MSVLHDGRLVLTVSTEGSARVEIRAADASGPRVVAAPAAAGSSVDGGGRTGPRRDGVGRDTDRGGVVGDVLFTLRSGQWRATRLDLRRLEPTGPSVSLPDMPGDSRLGPSLAWFPGNASLLRELVWVSRTGAATSLGMAPAYFRWPRLSPDARRLALGSSRDDALVGTETAVQVGVVDLQTGGRTWLDGFSEPVWTADGRRVVTSLGGQPFAGLAEQVADASRPIETIFTLDAGDAWPTSASRDGAWLVYYGKTLDSENSPATRDLSDIFVLDRRTGQRQRHALAGYQRGGRLSPDAGWLAYQTTDGARTDVRVRAFPALDADYTVSTEGGGQEPAWSADGKELYYRRGPDMMRVKVPARGETVIWPPPELLFTGNYAHDFFGDQSYDVAPDGRFLMLRPLAKDRVEIHVVLGWMAEVEARLRSSN